MAARQSTSGRRVGKVPKACSACGTVVERYPSQMRGKVYCSNACLGTSRRNGSELFCALCDSPFYRRLGEQDIGVRVRQFCSRRCYTEWRAIHRSPETYLKMGKRHAHRVVAESVLGRRLREDEVVHHIDGDKQNNAPENLAVFPDQSHHARCHQGNMTGEELSRYMVLNLAESEAAQ